MRCCRPIGKSPVTAMKWIDYQHVPEDVEREHIAQAIELHTGGSPATRPLGWYQGRTSPNTARLVAQEGGFLYDADSYADDLPYWDHRHDKAQLIVPYTLDANDMKFVALNGFTEGNAVLPLPARYVRPAARRGRPDDVGRPARPHRRATGERAAALAQLPRSCHRRVATPGSRAASTSPATGWRSTPHDQSTIRILLAEVTAAFADYERALMADDVAAMDRAVPRCAHHRCAMVWARPLRHRGDPRVPQGTRRVAAAQAGKGRDHRLWDRPRQRQRRILPGRQRPARTPDPELGPVS
jgi:hypothetical protein